MNFLKLNELIVMPTFDDSENDDKAKIIVEEVYGKQVETN